MLRWALCFIAATHCVTSAVDRHGAVDPVTYTPIQDGIPITGFVSYRGSQYYRLTVPLPLPRLDIVVTPLVGTPDIYATAGPYWDPAPDNTQWRGAYPGAGIISIPANASFTAMGISCRLPNATNCTLQVCVYGTRESNYTVVVTTAGGSDVLTEGVPAVGSSPPPGEANIYNFSATASGPVPASIPLSVSLARLTLPGSTLVVLVASSSWGSPRPVLGDNTTYCTSGMLRSGTAASSVTIANTSSCACAVTAPCKYFVAIATPRDSPPALQSEQYTLTVTTDDGGAVTLLEGEAAYGTGSRSGAPVLYSFTARLPQEGPNGTAGALEFILTATSGSAVFYVGFGDGSSPGPGAAAYASPGGDGPQVVSVSGADAAFIDACGAADGLRACALRIAVYTTSVAAAWSFVATAGAATSQLLNGVPTTGIAAGGSIAHYRFYVAVPGQALLITAAALSGDPSLFVGCDSDNRTTTPSPADPSSYIWSSMTPGDEEVSIDPTFDARACSAPCNYYIGIAAAGWAAGDDASFVVLAHTNGTASAPTPLSLGSIVNDAVPAGRFNAYELPFDPSASSITVAALAAAGGPIALYARVDNSSVASGTLAPVTSANAQYTVSPFPGSDAWESVTLTTDDDPYRVAACAVVASVGSPCTVRVSVFGNATDGASSSFQLSASAGVRQLADAAPIVARVQAFPAIVYFRYLATGRTPLKIIATPTSGDPDMLVSVGTLPNATNAQWVSRSPGEELVVVQVRTAR